MSESNFFCKPAVLKLSTDDISCTKLTTMPQKPGILDKSSLAWPVLYKMMALADEIKSNRYRFSYTVLTDETTPLLDELIIEFSTAIHRIPKKKEESKIEMLHWFLENMRQISNDVFYYRRLIRKRDPQKRNQLDLICQKLIMLYLAITTRFPDYGPMESLAHEYMIWVEMVSFRRDWKYLHRQLIDRIDNADVKLVAMNVIRECRGNQYRSISWRRLDYNKHIKDRLTEFMRTQSRKQEIDQAFIDTLLQWEYYDDDFICYYIQHIEDSLQQAATRKKKMDALKYFYSKLELMQPTIPAFCFSVATEESEALPPVKELLTEILNYHSSMIDFS